MSQFQCKPDFVSGCRILTQYPIEEFTFKWQVTIFSKIFNSVRVQFKTVSGATTWELRLEDSNIELWRYFEGQSVRVTFECELYTGIKTYKSKGCHNFSKISGSFLIMKFSRENIYFKDDIFNFKCTLNIYGHSLTHQIKSADSDMTRYKQLSCDMKDLFEKQQYCDLTMIVGQEEIQVHKSVLCARSSVFNTMFQHTMLETDCKEVHIDDIDFNVLKCFLVFLYSGELKELSWNRAFQLYYAADKYEIMDLREACSEYLRFSLESDNVCDILILADMHRDEKLKESAIFYTQMNYPALEWTDNWQELIQTHPKLAAEICE